MVIVTSPQVSLAEGASKVQALEHSTVLLGAPVMVGLVVSCTVTFWLHSAALPQVSLAAGASKVQELAHSTVLSPTQVIVGLVVSSTVTFWLHSAMLPHSSVARQVRVASKVRPQ